MCVSHGRSGRAFVRVRSLGVGSPPIHMFDPIYIYREIDCGWLSLGGVTRHLALVPLVSPAFYPPVDLNK